MTKRIILGGLLGGVVMFIWGAVSHMVLGLHESAVKSLPVAAEPAVLTALKAGVDKPGVYLYPGMEDEKHPTPEQQKQWEDKYRAGPAGILVYQPQGGEFAMPKRLLKQVGSDIAVALLAALLLSTASVSLRCYRARSLFVTALGLLPWLALSFPYWNWYGFPANFTMVELLDRLLTFFCGGLVLAGIVKKDESV